MLPRKKIDSSLRNNRSINLNLSDHVCFFAGKYEERRLQSKERINVCFICDDITRYERDTW